MTLSRERSQTEFLGPSQRLEKICLGFYQGEEGLSRQAQRAIAARRLHGRARHVCVKASAPVGRTARRQPCEASDGKLTQPDQCHGEPAHAEHFGRFSFGFLQQRDGLADAIGKPIGMS